VLPTGCPRRARESSRPGGFSVFIPRARARPGSAIRPAAPDGAVQDPALGAAPLHLAEELVREVLRLPGLTCCEPRGGGQLAGLRWR